MKIINFNKLIEMPWKNGLGVTRQIAIYPEEASLNDFMFRISAASVTQTGAFSEYPKINRSLAVLEGEGLDLALNNKSIIFTPKETIVHFHGTDCANVTACPNSVLDFGVMSQEDKAKHTLEKIDWIYGFCYQRKAPFTLIFSLNNTPVYLSANGEKLPLNKYDSLFLASDDSTHIELHAENNTDTPPIFFIAEFTLLK